MFASKKELERRLVFEARRRGEEDLSLEMSCFKLTADIRKVTERLEKSDVLIDGNTQEFKKHLEHQQELISRLEKSSSRHWDIIWMLLDYLKVDIQDEQPEKIVAKRGKKEKE